MQRIKKVPVWRGALVSALLIGLSLLTQKYLKGEEAPPFFGALVTQTSNATILCFPLLYALLVVSYDFNRDDFCGKSLFGEARSFFGDGLWLSGAYVLLMLAINLIVYLLYTGFAYGWGAISMFPQMSAMDGIMGILLFFARTLFSVLLVGLGNRRFAPLGFLLPLCFSFLDWMFYDHLFIFKPWGILPLENSSLFDTSFFGDQAPTPYSNQLVYWTVVFALLYVAAVLLKPRGKTREKERRWSYFALAEAILLFSIVVNLLYNLRLSEVIEHQPIGFLNLFYYGAIQGDPILAAIFPVVAILATTRIGGKNPRDTLGKVGLMGFGAFAIPYLVCLLVFYCIQPNAAPMVDSLLGQLAQVNLPFGAFVFLFILYIGILGALFALLGRGLSLLAGEKSALPFLFPLLYFNIDLFNGFYALGGRWAQAVFLPLPTAMFAVSGVGKSFLEYGLELALLCAIVGGLFWYAGRRQAGLLLGDRAKA